MLEKKFTGNCSFILKHSLIHLQSPLYTSEGGDESGVYPGNNMGAHPEWDISSTQLTTHWHHTWWQFSTDNFTTSWFLGGAANQMARKKPTRTWGEHVNLYKDSKPNSGSNQRCEVATLTTPHPSYNITYKKKKNCYINWSSVSNGNIEILWEIELPSLFTLQFRFVSSQCEISCRKSLFCTFFRWNLRLSATTEWSHAQWAQRYDIGCFFHKPQQSP